jgi:mRNA interferase HigB
MQVISVNKLVEFWKKHRNAKKQLAAWLKVAEDATWKKWADVTATYAKASLYKCCIVFNICGGSYRLVARRDEKWTSLLVVDVYTHQEYDKDSWKDYCK